jgi:hypothetical protein
VTTAALGLEDGVDVEAGADVGADSGPSRVGDDAGDDMVQPAASRQTTTDRTTMDTGKPRAATDRR